MDMSRIRIEGLLAAFPKLVGSGKQHTYVETENVRYVYQPIEVSCAVQPAVYEISNAAHHYVQLQQQQQLPRLVCVLTLPLSSCMQHASSTTRQVCQHCVVPHGASIPLADVQQRIDSFASAVLS
jgi:hypothetical protein